MPKEVNKVDKKKKDIALAVLAILAAAAIMLVFAVLVSTSQQTQAKATDKKTYIITEYGNNVFLISANHPGNGDALAQGLAEIKANCNVNRITPINIFISGGSTTAGLIVEVDYCVQDLKYPNLNHSVHPV